MRRRVCQVTEGPGNDSFLDIVANIVGILIILVMVTGVRAKQWPAEEPPQEVVPAAAAALENERAAELALRRDVQALMEQEQQIVAETAIQNEVRMRLATAVAGAEHQIESRRNRLDAASQEDFRLRRGLAESQSNLERLRGEIHFTLETDGAPMRVESYPTPLGKTVEGREIHFQLKGGRVAYIPLEALLNRFKQEAQRQMYKLRDLPEFTDTVGPEGGFRLRYTVVRRDLSPEMQIASGIGGGYGELERWTLIPAAGELGEPVDVALAEGSRFREVVASHSPQATTITIWTYPDSFAGFRRLKEELFRMGFATAARPLPEGTPIGGSPHGTKSAAE